MSGRKIKVACIQLRSSDDMAANLHETSALIRRAQADGARFIATPENTCLMAPDGGAKLEKSYTESADPTLPAFCGAGGFGLLPLTLFGLACWKANGRRRT